MEDNNNLYHLLVNPYKVNRNKKVIKETTIDDVLINILKLHHLVSNYQVEF